MLLYFFEGPIFSLIFANCLRGLGKWTKDGSALLTAAISGGAAWPLIMYGAAKGGHRRYQYSYCVVAAALAVCSLLPLWQNVVPAARRISDPVLEVREERAGSSGSGRSNDSGRGFGGVKRRMGDTLFVERVESSTDHQLERIDSLERTNSLERIDTLERNNALSRVDTPSSNTNPTHSKKDSPEP